MLSDQGADPLPLDWIGAGSFQERFLLRRAGLLKGLQKQFLLGQMTALRKEIHEA